MTSTEKDLRKRISKERNLEIKKYGRMKIYSKVSKFLKGDKRTAFSLINYAPAIIDDVIDIGINEKQLDRAIHILTTSFQERKISLKKEWEKDIFSLGQILLKLQKDDFIHATDIFYEVIAYWKIEKRNLSRKNKILNSGDLDGLNLKIGNSVGLQFLYLLCPELNKNIRGLIASLYGFAIKLADNISDLDEDLKQGYINISKENIKKYNLQLKSLSKKNLQDYMEMEYKRVKEYYKKGDVVVERILKQYPSQKEGILLFKDIAYSWFKQVSEVCNAL